MIVAAATVGLAPPLTEWCTEKPHPRHRGKLIPAPGLTERLHSSPPSLVVDVGAFDGGDTIRFAKAGGHHVWTFEAAPTKARPIQQRFVQEGIAPNVSFHNVALSNYSGVATLKMFRQGGGRGGTGIYNKFNAMMGGKIGSAFDTLTTIPTPTPTSPSSTSGQPAGQPA